MKKLFSCMIVILLLSSLLAACGNDEVSEQASEASDAIVATTPVKDLNGREINVLCHDFSAGVQLLFGYTGEIMYAEENPSSVDDAKKVVVDYIETAYNCTINGELTSSVYGEDVVTIVRNQVTSGLHQYDIVFDTLGRAPLLALEGMLIDLKTVENIDLSDAWWDQNAVNDLSVDGKVYFVNGDINTYDDQGTWCLLFNKTLKSELGIEEDFYQLVKDDKWTYDKFVEICTENDITYDSTGDGVLDEKDTWAFGTETYNIYIQVAGAGIKIAEKNSDDLPYLTASTAPTETYNILSHVLDFYNQPETVLVANTEPYLSKGFHNVFEATVHTAFLEGRELFYMCGLMNGPSFRTMSDEFGILPIPKYYENQTRYYHTISAYNSTVLMIPSGTPDLADLGLVITAIAEQSKQRVTPAYYDVQLKYRDLRDNESGEMLDLIFASRTFDLGCYYNWGNVRDLYTDIDKNVASRFEAKLSQAELEMQEFINALTSQK